MRKTCQVLFSLIFLLSACTHTMDHDNSNVQADTTMSLMEKLDLKISVDSLNPDLFHQRAACYLKEDKLNNALRDIYQAIKLDPQNYSHYLTLSDVYLYMGKPDEARETIYKAIDMAPMSEEPYLKMAEYYLALRQYPAVFEYIKQAIIIEPYQPRAYFVRAYARLEYGDTLKALPDLHKAVEQDQHFFDAYLLLGNVYQQQNNSIFLDYFNNALAIQPSNIDLLFTIGLACQSFGQPGNAIAAFQRIISIDSTNAKAYYNLGYVYFISMEAYDTAVALFSRAIESDPLFTEAYYNRGLSYEIMEDLEKAHSDYAQTLRVHPNYPKAIEAMNRLDNKMTGKNRKANH